MLANQNFFNQTKSTIYERVNNGKELHEVMLKCVCIRIYIYIYNVVYPHDILDHVDIYLSDEIYNLTLTKYYYLIFSIFFLNPNIFRQFSNGKCQIN